MDEVNLTYEELVYRRGNMVFHVTGDGLGTLRSPSGKIHETFMVTRQWTVVGGEKIEEPFIDACARTINFLVEAHKATS